MGLKVPEAKEERSREQQLPDQVGVMLFVCRDVDVRDAWRQDGEDG